MAAGWSVTSPGSHLFQSFNGLQQLAETRRFKVICLILTHDLIVLDFVSSFFIFIFISFPNRIKGLSIASLFMAFLDLTL